MKSSSTTLLAASLALAALAACHASVGTNNELESSDAPAPAAPPSAPPELPQPLVLLGTAYEAALLEELPELAPGEGPGLHNIYALGDSILCGSEPEGQASLEHLAELGVRTLLSVDGKAPEAEAAAALGMRYVHVPIQYAGIEPDELLAIAKVFRELPGPFYVHCFHGRHRGPAAAAVGRIVLDGISRERALAEMRQWCATSGDYEGLYEVIAAGTLPTAEQSAEFAYDFPARKRFEGLRGTMVPLVRHWDQLKAVQRRGWVLDPEHPDVVPAQEALQLAQLYAAMEELGDERAAHADFADSLASGRIAAERIHALLGEEREGSVADALETAYQDLKVSCRDCHRGHRNRR